MNKEEIKVLAQQLMFSLNEEELQAAYDYLQFFIRQLALLEGLKTSEIVPQYYPVERETDWLREDVVSDVMAETELFKNTERFENGLLVVAKVANR